MAYIYRIRNVINSKVYIGSTNNVKKRFDTHICNLRNKTHHNKHLQNAWNKYGEDKFEFEIIEECEDSIKFQKEQKYIDKYKYYWNNCYNISVTASGGTKNVDVEEIKLIKQMIKYGVNSSEIAKEMNKKKSYIERIMYKVSFVDIYSEYNKFLKNRKLMKNMETKCIIIFGMKVSDLVNLKDKSFEMKEFIEYWSNVLYVEGFEEIEEDDYEYI